MMGTPERTEHALLRSSLVAISAFSGAIACTGCAPTQPVVEQIGAMRHVMREGHTEGRIRLADAVARPHAIAVGALEGLNGEITIFDGNVWVARVTDDGLSITGPKPTASDQATLLTLAHVGDWQSTTVDVALEGSVLESFIEVTARNCGIDTSQPFPFIIEGNPGSMEVHVINGYCPIATDPSTVDAQPWHNVTGDATDMTIVGFFAMDAVGVMTHHGSSVHMHVVGVLNGQQMTAHVDRVQIKPGMSLRLPAMH